jgi:hypothetical protein
MESNSDGSRWRGHRGLGNTPDSVGVARIRHLHKDRLEKGNIGCGRHPVVEKAPIQHSPLLIELITLAQRSADPDNSAMDLPCDMNRVDGLSNVLDRRVPKDLDLSGFGSTSRSTI